MRRLIMWNLITLDGYFEGPQPGGLDWHEYAWGEELEQLSLEQLRAADTLLFGRVTYQLMAAYWPPARDEIAAYMNSMPKVVFSRTLERAEWANTRLVKEDAPGEVARLKGQPGKDILVFGSANLCATLMRHGLIDEYRLGLAPVVLGGGVPLFKPSPDMLRMRLLGAKTYQSGCVVLRYEPYRQS